MMPDPEGALRELLRQSASFGELQLTALDWKWPSVCWPLPTRSCRALATCFTFVSWQS